MHGRPFGMRAHNMARNVGVQCIPLTICMESGAPLHAKEARQSSSSPPTTRPIARLGNDGLWVRPAVALGLVDWANHSMKTTRRGDCHRSAGLRRWACSRGVALERSHLKRGGCSSKFHCMDYFGAQGAEPRPRRRRPRLWATKGVVSTGFYFSCSICNWSRLLPAVNA
jgi:hypothetical protein